MQALVRRQTDDKLAEVAAERAYLRRLVAAVDDAKVVLGTAHPDHREWVAEVAVDVELVDQRAPFDIGARLLRQH